MPEKTRPPLCQEMAEKMAPLGPMMEKMMAFCGPVMEQMMAGCREKIRPDVPSTGDREKSGD